MSGFGTRPAGSSFAFPCGVPGQVARARKLASSLDVRPGSRKSLNVWGGRAAREFSSAPTLGTRDMPRYFFDLLDDKTVYDRKGVALPDLEAAREFAVTFGRELMDSKPELLGESWSAWSVEVSNARFERVLKISFAEIIGKGG
jgi:hypothetical protein